MSSSHGLRQADWAYFATMGAAGVFVVALLFGDLRWALGFALLGVVAWIAVRAWSRRSPSPMPHAIRWVLFLPRGPQAPRRLERILEPVSGERILEVGPGVGIYSIPIASALGATGRLDVLDIQEEMLADLSRRAERAGIGNIVERSGDVQDLPYGDQSFDAAYLVYVLGEVPDVDKALGQLRRVLKPGGRLVVGEMFLDPDFVRLSALVPKATAAGFRFERRSGPQACYLARFSASVPPG